MSSKNTTSAIVDCCAGGGFTNDELHNQSFINVDDDFNAVGVVVDVCNGNHTQGNKATINGSLNHNKSFYSKKNGVLISFNYDSFESFPEDVTQHLFVVGDVWLDRELLKTACQKVANQQGSSIHLNNNTIECNRAGKLKRKKGVEWKHFLGGPLRTGCTWMLTMISVVKKRNSKNDKLCNSFLVGGNVSIVNFCGKHTNCMPGAMNIM